MAPEGNFRAACSCLALVRGVVALFGRLLPADAELGVLLRLGPARTSFSSW